MQVITIKGNIGKDGTVKDVRGRDVLSFSVGVKQGYGDNTSTNWYRVQVWGKMAQTLLPKAVKGVTVIAMGNLKVSEYQGKPSFDVDVADANHVNFVGAPKAESRPAAPAYQEELDDDCPF